MHANAMLEDERHMHFDLYIFMQLYIIIIFNAVTSSKMPFFFLCDFEI